MAAAAESLERCGYQTQIRSRNWKGRNGLKIDSFCLIVGPEGHRFGKAENFHEVIQRHISMTFLQMDVHTAVSSLVVFLYFVLESIKDNAAQE